MERGRIDLGLWAGHIALALAFGPLLEASGSMPALVAYGVAALYVLAPWIGYRWTLRGSTGPVPEPGPCQRTGSRGRWHWFEWAERPGERWWTRDQAVADSIRARRDPLPRGTLELQLRPGPDPRAPLQLDRMMKSLTATTGGVVVGFFAFFAWLALTSGMESGYASFAVSSLACAPVSLLPLLVAMWVGTWAPFYAAWAAWHRLVVPSRARQIRWNGPQLRTEAGAAYLDEPGTSVELAHGRFGTLLSVDDGKERLDIHGDHATLAPLADALRARVDQAPTTDDEARDAKAWTQRLRARAAQKA